MSETLEPSEEQVIDILTPITKREDLSIETLEEEVADDLPAKFKGKTAKEIAASALEADDKRKAELKVAKTGAGTGSSAGGKKVYLRADLIKLRQFQPDKYNSLDKEIQQAYAEGRVR